MNETQLETALAHMREKGCGWSQVERYALNAEHDGVYRYGMEDGDRYDRLARDIAATRAALRYVRDPVPVPPEAKARMLQDLNATFPRPDPGKVGAELLGERDPAVGRPPADTTGGEPIPYGPGNEVGVDQLEKVLNHM